MSACATKFEGKLVRADKSLVGQQIVVWRSERVGWDVTPIAPYHLTVEEVRDVDFEEVPVRAQEAVATATRIVRVQAHCPHSRYTWTFFVNADSVCILLV